MPRLNVFRQFLFVALAAGVIGCGLSAPSRGEPRPGGVAVALFEHRANSTDLLRTQVVFPADPQGVPEPGRHPGVVLIQGGLVSNGRYLWLAERLAQRGFVVAVPEHKLDLAIFSIENGLAARELLLRPPAGSALDGRVDKDRLAVGGHSLGGVVAGKLALRPDAFGALVLHASLPDSADVPALRAAKFPALSLAGRNDCSAQLASVREGATGLPSPSALVVLDGVTHYQFTDSDQEDVARKCASGVPLALAHDRIAEATAAFLLSALSSTPSIGEPSLRAIAGAEVTVR